MNSIINSVKQDLPERFLTSHEHLLADLGGRVEPVLVFIKIPAKMPKASPHRALNS